MASGFDKLLQAYLQGNQEHRARNADEDRTKALGVALALQRLKGAGAMQDMRYAKRGEGRKVDLHGQAIRKGDQLFEHEEAAEGRRGEAHGWKGEEHRSSLATDKKRRDKMDQYMALALEEEKRKQKEFAGMDTEAAEMFGVEVPEVGDPHGTTIGPQQTNPERDRFVRVWKNMPRSMQKTYLGYKLSDQKRAKKEKNVRERLELRLQAQYGPKGPNKKQSQNELKGLRGREQNIEQRAELLQQMLDDGAMERDEYKDALVKLQEEMDKIAAERRVFQAQLKRDKFTKSIKDKQTTKPGRGGPARQKAQTQQEEANALMDEYSRNHGASSG